VVPVYPSIADYDRAGYVGMLATQSSYAPHDPERRGQLFDPIGELIDERLAGTISKQYVTILARALYSA
jgi:hypothetical protein